MSTSKQPEASNYKDEQFEASYGRALEKKRLFKVPSLTTHALM